MSSLKDWYNHCRVALISDPIKHIINGFPGEEPSKELTYLDNFFKADYTYNWEEIHKLFSFQQLNHVDFTYEFGVKCAIKLRPIWLHSERYLAQLLQQDYIQFEKNVNWIQSETILWTFLKEEQTESSTIKNILLLTSVLENALGNVYFTLTKKTPPHLFRDLLNTSELKKVFGGFPVFFLKILLGTPNCVNIRNIVWHGFPSTDEIPSYYTAVIMLCIISFGKILLKANFEIDKRDKITNLTDYFDGIEGFIDEKKLESKMVNVTYLNNIFSKIPSSHIPIWKRIYKLYESDSFIGCVLLLLPQMELLFRIIFGNVNCVDISAKRDEYYIILDTVFEEYLENGRSRINEVYREMDLGVLKLIHDIFISPFGPRIRDKISHGEVDLNTLDKRICKTLIYLSLCILNEDVQLGPYESQFHPNSSLNKDLISTELTIFKVRSLEVPEQLQTVLDWDLAENPSPYAHGLRKIQHEEIKIFFRPEKEPEIVTYLTNIIKSVDLACCNLMESFEERFDLFEKKLLRSKRRQTLIKMLQTLPKVWYFLYDILNISNNIFDRLQSDGDGFLREHGNELLRCLKHVLKFAENMSKYCNKASNVWERCEALHSKFYELLNKHKKILV